MKILSVPRWMLLGNNGAGWLPNVTLIANDLTGGNRKRVINNEVIHQLQQDEVGYIAWVLMYFWFHFSFELVRWWPFELKRKYGYQNNPFEIDSRDWDEDLANRPARYWATCEKA